MKPFHTYKETTYKGRDEYKNRTHVAIDWPTSFEHNGETYTVSLTGTSKNFPAYNSPTSIWLRISSGEKSLVYFVMTSSPSWFYIETFLDEKESFSLEERQSLENAFLDLSTYSPVEITGAWKGGSIEDHWNTENTYDAKKIQLESDAEEREMYGGKTWQEYQDDL